MIEVCINFMFLLSPAFLFQHVYLLCEYQLSTKRMSGVGISQSLHLLPYYNDKVNVIALYILSLSHFYPIYVYLNLSL